MYTHHHPCSCYRMSQTNKVEAIKYKQLIIFVNNQVILNNYLAKLFNRKLFLHLPLLLYSV